ncbi:predicted protein [Sclerotinia sclerotiorum 1980 UF-70]|uniref:non-specific serine/threonine protein kinase n=2 Tax=Sclerotinia sclerotiorum (strain ATCC 18683 / 1980 / Ss-1) TaxID=665079 RepID=A7ESM5_SCLS1|nr:predicted protein [Sclerotinia sclerotiorum 1980 UF-70]APA12865.1 hypothetical protein sscle_10g076350 [Sclerotinia sclerotiorum 1980 UF-70]EDN92467.1 predicted protein [Sclerotinia sclerotiorum 1980 UF-70]
MALTSWDLHEAEARLVNYHRSLTKNPKTIRHNKWRPDATEFGELELKDLVFEGILGAGGFGSVYRVLNLKTQNHYALKIQSETAEQRDSRQKRTNTPSTPHTRDEAKTSTPSLTPSSESSIHSIQDVSIRNLISKRYRENRCYLQYIKSGHPNICALEAFLDFTSEIGDPSEQRPVILASYYEYCEGGTLQEIIDGYGDGYRKRARIIEENREAEIFNRWTVLSRSRWERIEDVPRRKHPPELFIWHIFTQSMGAIAFLHNEHPDYMDREEHRRRAMVMTMDLAPGNIFLKWNTKDVKQRRRTYPDAKVGDFGGASFVPKGGHLVMGGERLDFVWSDPPESDVYDGKTDVWCIGAMIYMLGTQAKMCQHKEEGVRDDGTKEGELRDERMKREERQRLNPERVGELEGMYSSTLNKAVKAALRIERDKRPSSGPFCKQLENSYRMRKPLMFRTLPEWALSGRRILKYKFPEGRVEHLVSGESEKENEKMEQEEMLRMQEQAREAALMWVEKDRKLKFGIKLEEWEEGDDEDHAKFLSEMIRDTPEFYKELLAEAKISVPSP